MNTSPIMFYRVDPVVSRASKRKLILDGKFCSSQEDRISKRIWHENITKPDLIKPHRYTARYFN